MWSTRRAVVVFVTACACVAHFVTETQMNATGLADEASPVNAEEASRPPLFCKHEDIRRRGKWVEREEGGENVTGYRWEVVANTTGTKHCLFEPEFVSADFCRLTANSVIWVLGDSIMWESFASLVKLATEGKLVLSKRINARVNHHGPRGGFPVMVNVCNDTVTLAYRWTYRLEGLDEMFAQQFPTAIVLNTGAHYMPDEQYRARVTHALRLVRAWQAECRGGRRHLTACPFYWRTTAPGIPDCMAFTRPINDVTAMEAHVAEKSPGVAGAAPFYHWEKFRRQNDLAYEMLRDAAAAATASAAPAFEYDVVPGYEIGLQRPDTRVSESDCLHSRDPAIADAENVVLLHYLRSSRTEGDVARLKRYEHEFERGTNVNAMGTDLNWSLVNRPDYPY